MQIRSPKLIIKRMVTLDLERQYQSSSIGFLVFAPWPWSQVKQWSSEPYNTVYDKTSKNKKGNYTSSSAKCHGISWGFSKMRCLYWRFFYLYLVSASQPQWNNSSWSKPNLVWVVLFFLKKCSFCAFAKTSYYSLKVRREVNEITMLHQVQESTVNVNLFNPFGHSGS